MKIEIKGNLTQLEKQLIEANLRTYHSVMLLYYQGKGAVGFRAREATEQFAKKFFPDHDIRISNDET